MKRRPTPLAVAILAGGRSTRMGRDKARVRLGRRSLLTQVRTVGATLGAPVRVIRRDLVPACGPLSGIYTALASLSADAVLFLACDMPFVTAPLLRRLRRAFRRSDRAVFATVGRTVGFPFIVRRGELGAIRGQIDQADYSLQQLAIVLGARRMAISARVQPALFNLNTPDDLGLARRRAAERRSAVRATNPARNGARSARSIRPRRRTGGSPKKRQAGGSRTRDGRSSDAH